MSKYTPRVNMFSSVRNAQWSAQAFLGSEFIKLIAPAKVNLFLGVGERLDNGYHEVTTVLHALTLHDILYACAGPYGIFESDNFEAADMQDEELLACFASGGPNKNIGVFIDRFDKDSLSSTIDDPNDQNGCDDVAAADADAAAQSEGARDENIRDEGAHSNNTQNESADGCNLPAQDNMVFKAIDTVALAFDRTQPENISIRLEKNIPYEAGLGGGSSDAAATLLALAHFWDIDAHDPVLLEVARYLGSDVAFFLDGGCALYTDRGNKRDRMLAPLKSSVVLVKPRAGVSTSCAYAAFDEQQVSVPAQLMDRVMNACDAQEIPLYNNLTAAAEKLAPAVAEVHAWLVDFVGEGVISEESVVLCGSGATTFAITEDFTAACNIATQAQARGWWARATTFSAARAAIMPQ